MRQSKCEYQPRAEILLILPLLHLVVHVTAPGEGIKHKSPVASLLLCHLGHFIEFPSSSSSTSSAFSSFCWHL